MNLILDQVKCLCGNTLTVQPKFITDIVLHELAEVQFVCTGCKSVLEVSLKWNKFEAKKTIAQKINGQLVDGLKIEGSVNYNSSTGVFTFDDLSQAKHLTRFEEVPAFLTKGLSTSTKKEIRYWKALP